jgi:hypothetical protein
MADIKQKIPRRIGKSTEFRISIIELISEFTLFLLVLIYYHLILIIINYLQKKSLPLVIVLSRYEYKQKLSSNLHYIKISIKTISYLF